MTDAPIEGFTTAGVMRIAADILDKQAETLKECHTLDGEWSDEDLSDALNAYLREKTLARELRRRADESANDVSGNQKWTCFHCGETFTTVGAARDHFGASQGSEPGCILKVSVGAERGMLQQLRKAEEIIARYLNDDSDIHREMRAMQTRHADALRVAEELGYERGLRDARLETQP